MAGQNEAGRFGDHRHAGRFGKATNCIGHACRSFSKHSSVTVLPITGTLIAAPLLRINLKPSTENGLKKPSQVMVDKTMTIRCDKVGSAFGHVEADTLIEVERCLAVFLGIAK